MAAPSDKPVPSCVHGCASVTCVTSVWAQAPPSRTSQSPMGLSLYPPGMVLSTPLIRRATVPAVDNWIDVVVSWSLCHSSHHCRNACDPFVRWCITCLGFAAYLKDLMYLYIAAASLGWVRWHMLTPALSLTSFFSEIGSVLGRLRHTFAAKDLFGVSFTTAFPHVPGRPFEHGMLVLLLVPSSDWKCSLTYSSSDWVQCHIFHLGDAPLHGRSPDCFSGTLEEPSAVLPLAMRFSSPRE